ncbi:MAG: RHS repeat protein, partial [Actinobacteria bacterium]|nr:RHS repeat protein [Actinomycetota bacterium]
IGSILPSDGVSVRPRAVQVTRYAYTGSVLGLMSRVTDPNGNATAFAYDSRDRVTALTRITDPTTGTGPTWRFDYSTPWQTKVTDPNGNATTHHFDRRGRVTNVVDALGHARQAWFQWQRPVAALGRADRSWPSMVTAVWEPLWGSMPIDTMWHCLSSLEWSRATGTPDRRKVDDPVSSHVAGEAPVGQRFVREPDPKAAGTS